MIPLLFRIGSLRRLIPWTTAAIIDERAEDNEGDVAI